MIFSDVTTEATTEAVRADNELGAESTDFSFETARGVLGDFDDDV